MDNKEAMHAWFSRVCKNCGFTFGSHHGGTKPWPRDYCPGSEHGMDWEDGPGTVFKEIKPDDKS